MFVWKILTFFFVCIFAVCGSCVSQNSAVQIQPGKTSENAVEKTNQDDVKFFVRMSRSNCFGSCPVYNLTIFPNGKVVFEGIQYTKIIGIAESNLDKEKINLLIDEVDKSNFYSFKDFYQYKSDNCPKFMSDAPNIVVSINLKGKNKTILHNHGCEEDSDTKVSIKVFPQMLYKLENKIDEIAETKRWIGEGK